MQKKKQVIGNYHCNYTHGNLRAKYRQKEYLSFHLQKEIKGFLQCWKRLFKRPVAKPILLINALLKIHFSEGCHCLKPSLTKKELQSTMKKSNK